MIRRFRDSEGDTWAETSARSGYYKLSVYADGEVVETPNEAPARSREWVRAKYGPLKTIISGSEEPGSSLYQHAAAISTALANAAADGFYLDDGKGNAVEELDLNAEFGNFVHLAVPKAGG